MTAVDAKATKMVETLNKLIEEKKERIKNDLEQMKQLEAARDALLQQQLDKQRDALIEADDRFAFFKTYNLMGG